MQVGASFYTRVLVIIFFYSTIHGIVKFNFYLSVNREMGYDGIVLESWSRWAAYGVLNDPDMRSMVISNLIMFDWLIFEVLALYLTIIVM